MEIISQISALKSPQILELSGVGSPKILAEIDVPLKIDLPGVGENLQEHVHAAISFELRADISDDTWDSLRDPHTSVKHLELQYASHFISQMVWDCNENVRSEQGTGLYAMGVTHFAFQPLDAYTPLAETIYQRIEEKISKNEKKGVYSPGLMDQYRIQLERLRTGSPGYEIVVVPVFMSLPSKDLTLICVIRG